MTSHAWVPWWQKRAAATAPVHEAKSLDDFSPVQAARLSYVPRVPEVLTTTLHLVAQAERSTAASAADVEALAAHLPKLFGAPLVQFPRHSASAAAGGGGAGSGVVPAAGPLKVAIVFCGRQTPGAHNVVWGLYSALKRLGADNQVLGGWALVLFYIGLYNRTPPSPPVCACQVTVLDLKGDAGCNATLLCMAVWLLALVCPVFVSYCFLRLPHPRPYLWDAGALQASWTAPWACLQRSLCP